MLQSCLLAMPHGLKIGMDHGLERGPAIEWGHDASDHGRAGITVSMANLDETISTTLPKPTQMHKQFSSCRVFCLEASRGMPNFLYPATKVFCINWYWQAARKVSMTKWQEARRQTLFKQRGTSTQVELLLDF